MVSLNSILYIVVSAFAGIVATALYDTFRTPYPVNRFAGISA